MSQQSPPKSSGLVQWHGRARYYSPNSEVKALLVLDSTEERKSLESNPFKPGKTGDRKVRYREFVNPRSWSRAFSWIAFIPVVPAQWYFDYHSYFGHILSHHPPINRFTGVNGQQSGYRVTPDNAWMQLEDNLYRAVVALSGHYHIPCVLPFLPAALGYREMYTQKRHLKQILEQTREWFLVWFGALSYLVASLRSPWTRSWTAQLDHQWSSVLRSKGISPSFVDGLQNSLIVANHGVRRAGIVLDVYRPPDGQPTPEWYVEQGVAVWYRWDSEDEGSPATGTPHTNLHSAPFLLQQNPLANDLLNDQSITGSSSSSVAHDNLTSARIPTNPYAHLDLPHAVSPAQRHALSSLVETSTEVPQTTALSALRNRTGSMQPIATRPVQPSVPSSDSVAIKSSCSNCPSYQAIDLPEPSLPSVMLNLVSDSQDDTGSDSPEWLAFFQMREEGHKRIMRMESTADRQRRENRSREPATARAKVFEWYRSVKPGAMYERVPVLAKVRSDTLDSYGKTQKRYDPFYNEWDCCDEWGRGDDGEEVSAGTDDEAIDAVPVTFESAAASTLVQAGRYPPPTPPSYAEADHPTDIFVRKSDDNGSSLTMGVTEVFGRFYGFCYPVPGVETRLLRQRDEKEATFFLRVLGASPSGSTLPHAGHGEDSRDGAHLLLAAQEFLQALCTRQDPLQGSWDLRDECVRPVRLSARFKHVWVIDLDDESRVDSHDRVGRYYVFDGGSGEPWKFGVTSASAALLACRLPEGYTAYDLATHFVQHGVPFRTFYHSRMIPCLPPPPVLADRIPQRPFGHKFTRDDYDAYIHMRTLLLSQPHMQATLRRGGIIWRLAVGTLGTSRVASAPPCAAHSHQIEISKEHFFDDALTVTELDLVCGAYECVSDDGKRRSLKSWWPLARYYEKEECGENYGRWTPRRETWYIKRLQAIEHGGVQPLTYTEWKSTQHGPGVIRAFHLHVEQSSHQLLALHCNTTSALRSD